MTYRELVKRLRDIKVSEPEAEAMLLISGLFGATRQDTLLLADKSYPDKDLEAALCRRALGEPIQYIIGSVCFYGCTLKVSCDCLIPRSDTEVLCEHLIKELRHGAHVLELCTGSGCIPVAILKNRSDITCDSIELIDKNVALAKQNRDANGISPERLNIICADALDIDVIKNAGRYDAIISNPPYIRTDVIGSLSREVRFEPRAALDGGEDGMLFYNKFLTSYAPLLRPGGFFAFEIGFDQAQSISDLCSAQGFDLRIIKDYSGNDRVAIITVADAN